MLQSSSPASAAENQRERPLRVFMMDLWCIVPYYTGYLCQNLQEQGVDVTLGSITYHYDPTHFSRHGVHNDPGLLDVVWRLQIGRPLLRRGLKLLEACINMAWLPFHFLVRRPDILHVQYLQLVEQRIPFELWLVGFARKLGIKLVYTVHNELPHETGERHRRVFQRIYGMMDALICHTEAARNRLVASYGVTPERVHVIPHGPLFHDVRIPDPDDARRKLGFTRAECIVLWQGWIKPYKGLPFLLDAWAAVQKRNSRARLVIAGTGDERALAEIRRQVTALGLMHSVRLDLRFLNPVDELPLYYSAADILVYPYKEITTSGALMTGLSYGKAIIATRLTAFQEVLEDGRNGILTPYGDTEALASALLALIADPDLRTRLSAHAAEFVKQLPNSWNTIAQKTRVCYRNLAAPPVGIQDLAASAQ